MISGLLFDEAGNRQAGSADWIPVLHPDQVTADQFAPIENDG
jgi:hypothetical protein